MLDVHRVWLAIASISAGGGAHHQTIDNEEHRGVPPFGDFFVSEVSILILLRDPTQNPDVRFQLLIFIIVDI